jgi:hypothetical protein
MKVRREDGCKCVMRSRMDNLGVDLKIDDTRSWRTAEMRGWGIAGSDG